MGFDVEGILAPVFTPMNETGNVDLQVIPIYMAHLNKHRINGILVGGTTGEAMSLSVEERKALLEAWMLAAKPLGAKVIAQVGGAPLPDVLKLAKHAEKIQVDAIMTLPELYYKPKSVYQLVSYLETVSKAAPTRPLIYYHFPMMTGVDGNMSQLFTSASSKLPNFKGAKADLGVAEQVADQLAEDQTIFIANHHLAQAVLMGHESSIATVSNLFPDLVHQILDSVKRGEVTTAYTLQKRLNNLVDVIAAQGDFVPSMKAAMELVTGVPVGPPRSPLTPLRQNQQMIIKDTLLSLDVQVKIN
ncbi:N-acetylneuraminate lyase-like [Anticarsia gemmatalis]|uniref:N-acetylneuraminate lyase-like n=1 Tax=Anticarsia gemmatalis TaxID=129554 RepID=UPI003F76FBF3